MMDHDSSSHPSSTLPTGLRARLLAGVVGFALLLGLGQLVAEAQSSAPPAPPTTLAPVVVSSLRSPVPVSEVPVPVDVFSASRLQASPGSTVDSVLRESAAFSLFRRSGSLVANPTAQGVSLRGLGPSGASRSLILLDGVPLNDPFGGWIAWGKLARLSLSGAELVRGGGSGAWGNSALGGTIALFSQPPSPEGGGAASLSAGSFGTFHGELSASVPAGNGALRLDASILESDGAHLLAPNQRGPIDRPLDTSHRLVQLAWRQALSPHILATATARGFEEDRGNGTPLQRNASREAFASFSLEGRPSADRPWSALVYAQDQRLQSYFTAVDASRVSETPANDQFSVPSSAAGASLTTSWIHADAAQSRTSLGADARWVRGETREDFLLTAGRFTRRRFAGGEQTFAGVFGSHDRTLFGPVRGSLALRVDHWAQRDGHRREINLATGAPTRDDRFADQDGIAVSPRLGITAPLAPGWRVRAAGYQAFRVPTLNEYYRPFRVGIVNTEANPSLRDETVSGGEAGLDFNRGPWHLSLTGFSNALDDAVANVTLSRTPTLVSRQRRNLESIRVRGLEAGVRWSPNTRLSASIDVLLNDARVQAASDQPGLVGTRLAQTPRRVITAGFTWIAPASVTLDLRARHFGEQYEDDENRLTLAAVTTVDAQLSRRLTAALDGFLAAENLTNQAVETGRSTEGVVTLDSPRRLRVGLRARW